MLRGMAKLVTGGEIITIATTILVGAAIGMVIASGMSGGGRICVGGSVGIAMFGAILRTGMGLFHRYNKLTSGRCPNPLCHGVVQHSELVGKGNVVCPTCKRTWPELQGMRFRATARG